MPSLMFNINHRRTTEQSMFLATVCKTVCFVLPDHCLSILSVCDVGVLWPISWMD